MKKMSNIFSDRLIHLFLLYSICQFILHFYFVFSTHDPRLIMPTSVAYFHDITVLAIVTAVGYLATAYFGNKFKRITSRIFTVFLIISGVCLSFYPKFLREHLAFPVNIFNSDTGSAKTLLLDYLGLWSLVPCLIAFLLGLIVYRINFQIHLSKRAKLSGLILILLVFGVTTKKPSPQPFVYSLQKETASLINGEKRIVPSLIIKTTENQAVIIKQLDYSLKESFKYNHILLIVLEGVTAESFEEGFLTIPNGFYSLYKNKSVYYNNYFASNLDSYTSLIAMLTSVQVPYRAYADAEFYEKVNTAPSITEDFHQHGLKNYFISCYQYQPFVPTRKHWNKILERKDLPSIEKWQTLGSSKMELATEDKAAISTIIDIVKSDNKNFILHEMVYGHSPEWRATTGKTQNEYYNEYLMELSQILISENLFHKTLFVIVSDHGDRAKSSVVENYRIPLLIVGNHVPHQLRNEWLSHLDLPGIIYYYTKGDKHPESRVNMFFVGSTEKWVYGIKNSKDESLFIDDASGAILAQSGNLKAVEVMEEFQKHLNAFNASFVNDR